MSEVWQRDENEIGNEGFLLGMPGLSIVQGHEEPFASGKSDSERAQRVTGIESRVFPSPPLPIRGERLRGNRRFWALKRYLALQTVKPEPFDQVHQTKREPCVGKRTQMPFQHCATISWGFFPPEVNP